MNQAILDVARNDWKIFILTVYKSIKGILYGLVYSLCVTSLVMRLSKDEQSVAFSAFAIAGVIIGLECMTIASFVLGNAKLGVLCVIVLCLFNSINYLYNLPKRI